MKVYEVILFVYDSLWSDVDKYSDSIFSTKAKAERRAEQIREIYSHKADDYQIFIHERQLDEEDNNVIQETRLRFS